MPLTASCSALYFGKEPRDNLITFRYSADTPLPSSPLSFVIFKIKCSTPQSFHVSPPHGSILLADEDGKPPASQPNAEIKVSFSFVSSSNATAGHRFLVEYCRVAEEPSWFHSIREAAAEGSNSAMASVVKSLWLAVASGTVPASHVDSRSALTLVVNLETPGKPFAVPPNACLVPRSALKASKKNGSPKPSRDVHVGFSEKSGAVQPPDSQAPQSEAAAQGLDIIMEQPWPTGRGLNMWLLLLCMMAAYAYGVLGLPNHIREKIVDFVSQNVLSSFS